MSSSNAFPAPIAADGTQQISGTCSERDLIRLVTGNHMRTVSLVNVDTIGFPLAFTLVYNSQESLISPQPVGAKWRHNYMARLIPGGASLMTYVSEAGRHHNFVPDGSGGWMLQTSPVSYFIDAKLTNPSGSLWRMTFFPDQEYFEFQATALSGLPDSAGRLINQVDQHGNTTALTYSATTGLVTTIQEPTGRQIQLDYSGSLLTSVTDPMGTVNTLVYDVANSNLTNIVGPEGCLLTYGYSTPANHLITSRTDALSRTYNYTYNPSVDGQLFTVTDPETPANTLTYSYDRVTEWIAHPGNPVLTYDFLRTKLLDARGKTWDYRFDKYGSVHRKLTPRGHNWRGYYDSEQKLLYESEAFPQQPTDPLTPAKVGPVDIQNNRFRRYHRDANGNVIAYADAVGRVDHFLRDASQRVIAATPGRANLAIQGNWYDEFGADGHLLCAFDSAAADTATLPSYVSAIANGDSGGAHLYTRSNRNDLAENWVESRVLMEKNGTQKLPRRGIGFWTKTGSDTEFVFRVQLNATVSFNLSIYSNSCDSPRYPVGTPRWNYSEQFGRDIQLVVDDLDPYTGLARQQTFRMTNNALGYWATFPVSGDATHPVQVRVQAMGTNTSPVISALAFDSFYDTQMRYTYNGTGDMTRASGPLGMDTQMTYNADGTLATTLEAVTAVSTRLTQFFYEDTSKNLTRMVDAAAGQSVMQYDLNGNLLLSRDQNNFESRMLYDLKNRVVALFDNASNGNFLKYDAVGNLVEVKDALGRVTQFFYTPSNRLQRIVDALGGQTQFTWDPSGNLLTVTDQRNNTYTYGYSDDNEMQQITQPNAEMLRMAYDALGRVAAVTAQNGNQSSVAAINTVGSANWLKNPGAEIAKYTNSAQAQNWTNSTGSSNRDNTHQHTGQYSLPVNLTGTTAQYWSQSNLALAPGGRFLASVWASKAADGVSATVSMDARVRDLTTAVVDLNSANTTLTGSSTNWAQTPGFRFDVPADAQFAQSQPVMAEFRAVAQGSATTQAWLDDLAIYSLSTGYLRDGEDRLAAVQGPDGATIRIVRDRWGRVIRVDDALNRSVSTVYDSLNRVTATVDGVQNKLQFAYNFVSELVTFIDANNQSTGFTRDALGRISSIVYPDTTTEIFDYYANSDLLRYTDNQSRKQEFFYDSADRLNLINFLADATNVQFFYNGVGNRVKMIERGGDICLYQFDPLNRQIGDQRKGSGGAPSWQHTRGFDATSNQLVLYTNPSLFGSAVFGTSPVGTGTVFWKVPSPGYDSLDRMPAFQDANSNTVSQSFDVENRRTLLSWLSGSLTQAASYDITGRLLRLTTQYSAATIGQLVYGYDAASQRISLVTLNDTFDYEMDGASRLVGEAVNRFVERRTAQYADGSLVRTKLDSTNQRVQLLPFDDSFAGNTLDLSRWAVRQIPPPGATPLMGYEIRQRNGLQMAFPTGYTTNQTSDLTYCDYYGRSTANLVQCLEHQILLNGDFDIALDFAQFQFAAASLAVFSLTLTSAPNYSNLATQNGFYIGIGSPNGIYSYVKDVFVNGGATAFGQVGTSDLAGSLRLKRVGTTVTFYYFSGGSWVNPSGWTHSGLNFTTAYINLQLNTVNSNTSITLSNFRSLDANVPLYPPTGTYESTIYDAGRSVSWTRISWEQAVPGGTGISFQVAVAAAIDGPYNYVGPDGTSGTFFTTAAGQTLPTLNGRYGRYKAYMTSTGAATPNFGNVQISYSGTETSTATVTDYDPAGNITLRTITTNAGITTDVRNNVAWPAGDKINNLNQIKRRDFGGVTWRYTYQADGCTASRTDGTNTWTNTWDPAGLQHLQRVQGPGGVDVNYTNDYMGRMLTRVSGAATTVFQWDNWDCIGETTGASTTRWYAPQGQLLSFDRDGLSYEVISDALGSVRMVTDNTGIVVARFDYSAWGEVLASSFDSVPGGMPYRFIGSWGCRTDLTTGLVYMRARWYDSSLQRFISRDPIGLEGGANLYAYCLNNPVAFIDPSGLDLTKDEMDAINRARERERERDRLERERRERLERERGTDECKRRFRDWFDNLKFPPPAPPFPPTTRPTPTPTPMPTPNPTATVPPIMTPEDFSNPVVDPVDTMKLRLLMKAIGALGTGLKNALNRASENATAVGRALEGLAPTIVPPPPRQAPTEFPPQRQSPL